MKPGRSLSTGHLWELRSKPGDKTIRNLDWDVKNRCWITGLQRYFYCTDCEQWAWGAKSLCPKNVTIINVPTLVVKVGGDQS